MKPIVSPLDSQVKKNKAGRSMILGPSEIKRGSIKNKCRELA